MTSSTNSWIEGSAFGGHDRLYQKSKAITNEVRFDITSQITDKWRARWGVDLKSHKLDFYEVKYPWLQGEAKRQRFAEQWDDYGIDNTHYLYTDTKEADEGEGNGQWDSEEGNYDENGLWDEESESEKWWDWGPDWCPDNRENGEGPCIADTASCNCYPTIPDVDLGYDPNNDNADPKGDDWIDDNEVYRYYPVMHTLKLNSTFIMHRTEKCFSYINYSYGKVEASFFKEE